jgi:hypothetical protein
MTTAAMNAERYKHGVNVTENLDKIKYIFLKQGSENGGSPPYEAAILLYFVCMSFKILNPKLFCRFLKKFGL